MALKDMVIYKRSKYVFRVCTTNEYSGNGIVKFQHNTKTTAATEVEKVLIDHFSGKTRKPNDVDEWGCLSIEELAQTLQDVRQALSRKHAKNND